MTLRFLAAVPLMLALQGSLVPGKTQTFSDDQMFQNYAVADKFRGNIASLDLTSPDARMYRTQLRRAMLKGPQFAGFYAVATWGCGTGCFTLATVDLRTGKATFFANIVEWFDGDGLHLTELKYELHSRALHVVGDLNEQDDPADRWFVWTGSSFQLLRSTPLKRTAAKRP